MLSALSVLAHPLLRLTLAGTCTLANSPPPRQFAPGSVERNIAPGDGQVVQEGE